MTPALRIVHVVDRLNPQMGGLPMVAARLSAAMARAGHEVVLAATDAGTHGHRWNDLPGMDAVRVVELPAGRWAGIPSAYHRLVTPERTILHLHGAWDLSLRTAAAAARHVARPYLLTPHGMLDPWSLRQSRLKKWLAMHATHRAMHRRAAAIHVLNVAEGELIDPLGWSIQKVVIGNGVDLEEIDRGLLAEPPGDLPSRPTVLFLGRLHHKKSPTLLAEAFDHLIRRGNDLSLAMVGPDDGEADAIQAIARQGGWADRLSVPGPVYGSAKYHWLRHADAFVLPSQQEGFSVATLEAMACRTPVLLSPECHFEDAGEAGAGAIVPRNALAIAKKLEQWFESSKLREEMGRQGRRWVEAYGTWDRIAEAMISAYRHIERTAS